MKRIKLFLLFILLVNQVILVTAQEKLLPQGISYQAVALGTDGNLLAEKPIKVRFSLTSKDGVSSVFFQEDHDILTQDDGSFQAVIGQGLITKGALKTVPWSTRNIFLSVELAETGEELKLVSRSQMLAVPYAFVSQQAGRVTDPAQVEERDQSRYWLTGGNNATRPPVHFLGTRDNKPLHFKSNGQTRMKIDENGRFQIINNPKKTLKGKDTNKDVYPMYVESKKQGIWIEIEESRSSANNFLTFEDNSGVQGRVEGQTLSEARNEDLYKLQVALYALKAVSLTAQVIGEYIDGAGYAASGTGAGISVAAFINGTIMIGEIAIFAGDAASWAANIANDIGVAYQSGAGDYAEYMLRDTLSRELFPGEVIGIHKGQVSLNTDQAQHLSVVSTAPAVIGGMPQPGEEQHYEKVAYIGQVQVRVTGSVNIGDYILPSGNNDGLAIGVAPYKMKAGDYNRIIGIAWESAPASLLNIVNVAVGINSNDIGTEIAALSLKVNKIYDFLEGKGSLESLSGNNVGGLNSIEEGVTQINKLFTDEQFDQILEDNRETFEKVFKVSQHFFEAMDYDLAAIPEMKVMFNDPVAFLKELRRDPDFFTQWSVIDHQLIENTNH